MLSALLLGYKPTGLLPRRALTSSQGRTSKWIMLLLDSALCASLAALPAAGFAGENPGITAAPVLQLPLGARAVGMGTAYTALSNDASGAYYNPAGLSQLSHHETSFLYMKGFEDQKLEHIAAAAPLPMGLIGDYATLGASALFSQNGAIEWNRTHEDGRLRDSRTVSAGGDFVAAMSYSERVGNFEVRTRRDVYHVYHMMGISGKFIRSTLAEEYSASAYAVDLGYLLKVPEAGLSAGASLLNAGSRMRFISEGDPLPMTARVGLAYRPVLPEELDVVPSQTVVLATDGEVLMHERQWHANIGVEYSAWRNYAVRLGYRLHRDVAGLTVGFGAAWRNFTLDYAWAMSDDLTDVHRFGVTYRFGKLPARRRESLRRPFIEPESLPDREELRDIEERRPETFDEPERPARSLPDRPRVVPGWIY